MSPGGTDVNINDTHAITLMICGSRDGEHHRARHIARSRREAVKVHLVLPGERAEDERLRPCRLRRNEGGFERRTPTFARHWRPGRPHPNPSTSSRAP